MKCLEVKTFQGLDGLQQVAAQWDSLEQRSNDHHDCSVESVIAYVNQFGDPDKFLASLVYDGNRLIAAIPTQTEKTLRVFSTAKNLASHWFPGRSGILDPQYHASELAGHLLHGLEKAGISALELDWLHNESQFATAVSEWAKQRGLAKSRALRFESGITLLANSWEAFQESWSKNRKRFLRRAENRLAEQGDLYLVCAHDQDADRVDEYWDTCLKIEHGSWKGDQQSSLLTNPAANRYFRELVRSWHSRNRLQLYILKVNGRPIAFDLGYVKNGVAMSLKISYLADYAPYSPGHVLNAQVIRQMIAEGQIQSIDTVGELTAANRKWCETSYRCEKLELALPGWMNHSRVQIKDWMRTLKRTAKSFQGGQYSSSDSEATP